MQNVPQWLLWAGLSAVFAALTALFAKVGVKGVDPDLAMAIRTLVVAAVQVAAVPLVVTQARAEDYGLGVLVGLLAVPIAPVAKDLASSLSAAARAVKTVRSAAIT